MKSSFFFALSIFLDFLCLINSSSFRFSKKGHVPVRWRISFRVWYLLSSFFLTFETSSLSRSKEITWWTSSFWIEVCSIDEREKNYTGVRYRPTEIFPLTHEYLYIEELARMPHARICVKSRSRVPSAMIPLYCATVSRASVAAIAV